MLMIMKKLKKVANKCKKLAKLAVAPGFGHTTYWPI